MAKALAACGKARKTIQATLAGNAREGAVPAVRLPTGTAIASANPDVARAVQDLVRRYRERLPEIIKQARLPYDLPSEPEIAANLTIGVTAGPKKPALERVFRGRDPAASARADNELCADSTSLPMC